MRRNVLGKKQLRSMSKMKPSEINHLRRRQKRDRALNNFLLFMCIAPTIAVIVAVFV